MKKTVFLVLFVIVLFSACEYGTQEKIHYNTITVHKIILYVNGDCSLIKINDFEYSELPTEYSELRAIGLLNKEHFELENPVEFQISKLIDDDSYITAEIYINDELYLTETITNFKDQINFIITKL